MAMAPLMPADERDLIVTRILTAVRNLVAHLRAEINQMPTDRSSGHRPDPCNPSIGPSASRTRTGALSDPSRATSRFSALADLMFEVERACEGRPKMREVRSAAVEAQVQVQTIMALASREEAETRWVPMQLALRAMLEQLQLWARKERDAEKRALILHSQRDALVDHSKAGVALVRDLAELSCAPLTDERLYAERGHALVRHVQWLMAMAHQLGAKGLESQLREAMLSFFAAAKLAFRTHTPAARAALEAPRDAFLRAFMPLLAALRNPDALEADEAALKPAPETPAQAEKKQRTMRALHVSRRAPTQPQAGAGPDQSLLVRASAQLPRVALLQRVLRAWLRRTRWPRLVRQVQESPAAQPARLRFRAMHEVYTSERAYLFALTTLTGLWLERAQRAPKVWQAGDIEAVWGNVSTIRSLTIDLVADLRRAYNAFPGPGGSVGAVFLKYGPWLRLYQQYISAFNRSLARLTDVVAKRPGYAAYLEDCMAECARTGQAGLDLGAYLIMPVQRVPRHELLLRTLLKYTPEEHVEHASLVAALRKVKEVNERTNAVTTDVEAFSQAPAPLTETSGSGSAAPHLAADAEDRPPAVQGLSEVPGSHKAKLVSRVHAAERGAPAREALALLFKEVLVIAKKVDVGVYAVHLQLSTRSGMRVQESVPDMQPLRFGFEVEDKAGVCVAIYPRTAEDRRQWLAALKSIMKSAQFDDLLSFVSFKVS